MNKPWLDGNAIFRARSYDDAAEAYERINAPLFFEKPARALAEFARIEPGQRVLDVGAGTGAVTRAIHALGAEVVSFDPSVPMLNAAMRGGASLPVCGALPDLPFRDAVFDRVCSAFVLTHVDDPEASVQAMARVVRPGGRIALTAWSPSVDPYTAAWNDVVSEFVAPEKIAAAAQQVLPGEPRFSREDGLKELLAAAGLRDVIRETRTFEFAMRVEGMIGSREVSASGRALRMLLTDEQWNACRLKAREALGRKFPDEISYPRQVFFAAGTI